MRWNIYKIITCLMIVAVLTSTTTIPIQAQKLSRYDGVYIYKIEKSTEGRAIYAKEIHYRIEEGYKREYLWNDSIRSIDSIESLNNDEIKRTIER